MTERRQGNTETLKKYRERKVELRDAKREANKKKG
jgi:hypothetical protein